MRIIVRIMGLNINWSLGPQFPDLIKGGALGVADNCVVYAGGCSFPWRERETGWWLDSAEKEWKPLPPMPEGRGYTSGVTADNSLFVVGGRKRTGGQFGVSHRNCWRLSRKGGGWRWDILPEMRIARTLPSLAAVGKVIYCIGGGTWTRDVDSESVHIDEYLNLDDLASGWQEMPKCPGRRRSGAYTASTMGNLYVFGGAYSWTESGKFNIINLSDAWRFNPKTLEWHEVARLPVIGLANGAAVTFDDRFIILAGGFVSKERTAEGEGKWVGEVDYTEDEKRGVRVGWYNHRVFVYDAKENSYEELSEPLPYATNDPEVEILGDTVYVIGGENIDRSVSNTCAYVRVGKIQKTSS